MNKSIYFITLFLFALNLQAQPQNGSNTQSLKAPSVTSNLTELVKAAEKGNPDAQHQLGLMYFRKQQYQNAVEWFIKAANQNKTESQYYLGSMYYHGEGVQQDVTEAEKWLKKAANSKHGPSMFILAQIYQYDKGNLKNQKEALKLYTYLAQEQNFSLAQTQLGEMYELGQSVAANDEEAVKWYTRGAENGDAYGQYLLAGMYLKGKGVKKDDQRSFYWYSKSAESGFDKAQSMLALNYYLGIEPVKKDYVTAYMWLTISWEPRMKDIELMIDLKRKLEKVLTPEQINEAKRRAKEFKPKPNFYSKRG